MGVGTAFVTSLVAISAVLVKIFARDAETFFAIRVVFVISFGEQSEDHNGPPS